jgi:hypothetical protein
MYPSHPSCVGKNARRGREVVEIILNTIMASDWRIPSIGSAIHQLRPQQKRGRRTTRMESRLTSGGYE